MENVAERFIFLAHKNNANNLNKKELVFEACACEFATSIHGYEKRQVFINQLRIKLNLPVIADETKDECRLIKITDKISLPWPKRYFIEAIEQDLEMRWQAMLKQAIAGKSAKLPYYKQSIIVEGEPGSGKSVSLRALVQKHLSMLESRRQQLLLIKTSGSSSFTNEMEIELQLLTKEAAKRVEEISGGSADPQGKLTEAYHNEQLIINDEANLNREADQLISQFLCSTDENSQSVSRKGFMHLGSQNSTAHRGRKQQGTSDQNRTHFISLDDFTDAELEAFVKKNKIEHPDDFVKAYRKIKEQYPHVNMRTFHEVLKNYAKKQQTASLTNIPGITMHFNRTTPPLSTSVPIVPAKTFTV